jgi:nucleoside-diphosphate-sugar epimerase
VLAIFAGRLLSGRPPLIYDDGRRRRDFVGVHNAYGPDKPWFQDPALSGGGCVIDLGIVTVAEVIDRIYAR